MEMFVSDSLEIWNLKFLILNWNFSNIFIQNWLQCDVTQK